MNEEVSAGLLAALADGTVGLTSAAAQQGSAATNVMTIDNFMFVPMKLTTPAGTQVTWINKDDEAHTVASVGNRMFKSKALDTGDKFSFTFHDPGTHEYFCSIHSQMIGKIIVK